MWTCGVWCVGSRTVGAFQSARVRRFAFEAAASGAQMRRGANERIIGSARAIVSFYGLQPYNSWYWTIKKTTEDTHLIRSWPNKEERLLALPLLRTVRESFPSYRSSLS